MVRIYPFAVGSSLNTVAQVANFTVCKLEELYETVLLIAVT